MEYLHKFDTLISNSLGRYGTNPYVILVVQVVLIYYVMSYVHQLPPVVIRLLEHPMFKVFALFVILCFSAIAPSIALLLVIAIVVSMYMVNRYKLFSNLMKFEGMNGQQNSVSVPGVNVPVNGSVPQMLNADTIALSCPGHYGYNYGDNQSVDGYDPAVVDDY